MNVGSIVNGEGHAGAMECGTGQGTDSSASKRVDGGLSQGVGVRLVPALSKLYNPASEKPSFY